MAETIATRLATFVEGCELPRIPAPVVDRAKGFLLDYLGVALLGADAPSSRIMHKTIAAVERSDTCTVIGSPRRASCLLAALANGTSGHALEMDDDHRTSVLHPAVAVIPAALAAAEHGGVTGHKLLEGIIAGYEIMTRVGDAFLGTQYYEGFHPTGTCGVFGAAAAAGRVLGLTRLQLVAALGIAGTQAAGLEEWKQDGSWIKRLHPGHAAQAGVLAALLAREGYTGPATIFEGNNGFLKAFSYERKWDAAKILDRLGDDYRGYGTSFKPYACCRFSHQVIDAILDLMREHRLEPSLIRSVEVRIYRTAYLTLFEPQDRRYRPRTAVDAQFSIPYVVAVAILRGHVLPADFTDDAIGDDRLLAMASKVKGLADAQYESGYPSRFPTTVTVHLEGERSFSAYRDLPRGDPANPAYEDHPGLFEREIEEKFGKLVDLLPQYRARRPEMVRHVHGIEALSQVSPLARLFSP